MSNKAKKICILACIGLVLVTILTLAIFFIGSTLGKPSKKNAQKIINVYLDAINQNDGSKAISIIDAEGYTIFSDVGEKKFDKTYNNKKEYMEEYFEDNNCDDLEELENSIADSFEGIYKYNSYKYTLKRIVSIEKSSKSKKIVVIEAKVKKKNSYTSNTETKIFYLMKVKGSYKIICVE